MSEKHLKLVREIYDAASQENWDKIATYLHSEFFILQMDDVPYPGWYVGIEGFKELFGAVFGMYENTNLTKNVFCSGNNHVMVLLDFEGESKDTGEAFSVPMIELFRFSEDKLIEIRPFYWNTRILNDMAPK